MDLVKTVEGGENAPCYFVMGVSRIERLGPGTIRVSLYSRHDGVNKVEVQLIWDQQAVLRCNEICAEAFQSLASLPLENGPSGNGNPRSRGAH